MTASEVVTTLREAMRTGGRGCFAQALLKAYEDGEVESLIFAWEKADMSNRTLLEEVFPGLSKVALLIYRDWPPDYPAGLCKAFPGLRYLDEPTDNPHNIDLKGEE